MYLQTEQDINQLIIINKNYSLCAGNSNNSKSNSNSNRINSKLQVFN